MFVEMFDVFRECHSDNFQSETVPIENGQIQTAVEIQVHKALT